MYSAIPPGATEDDQRLLKERFKNEVLKNGMPSMLDLSVPKRSSETVDHDQIEVQSLFVAGHLHDVLMQNGFSMVGYPRIGEVEGPLKFRESVADLEAEPEQRKRARFDMEMAKETRESIMVDGLDERDALVAALAREYPESFRFIHVTGDSNRGIMINTGKEDAQ
jgi:hypothetical protein